MSQSLQSSTLELRGGMLLKSNKNWAASSFRPFGKSLSKCEGTNSCKTDYNLTWNNFYEHLNVKYS